MAPMLNRRRSDAHALLLGVRRPTAAKVESVEAKASDKNLGNDWNEAVGRALLRAIGIVGWSNKEAAAKVGVGEAELSKWLSGERRAHLDRILAVEELANPFLLCLLATRQPVLATITIPLYPAVSA